MDFSFEVMIQIYSVYYSWNEK